MRARGVQSCSTDQQSNSGWVGNSCKPWKGSIPGLYVASMRPAGDHEWSNKFRMPDVMDLYLLLTKSGEWLTREVQPNLHLYVRVTRRDPRNASKLPSVYVKGLWTQRRACPGP